MQGFIDKRGQNRQGRTPANSAIQGRGKQSNPIYRQLSGQAAINQKNKETVQGSKTQVN